MSREYQTEDAQGRTVTVNMDNVCRGAEAVDSTKRYKANLNTVSNVLLDLLHYCAHYGKNFDQELAKAQKEFLDPIMR